MEKQAIISKLIAQQEKVMSNLEHTLDGFRQASDIDETEVIDREELGQQAESKDMQLRMQVQLDAAKADHERLMQYANTSHAILEPGALVETDKKWFFIGLSLPATTVENKDVVGVSIDSPAFQQIKGMQKGDSFKLGNQEFTILSVQ